MKEIWSADLSYDPNGKENLVIHCSDWRFVDLTRAFLHEHLKVKGYDLIVVPGAVHFLVSHLLPKYSWVARHWLKFFFKHHGTKRVIVLTHKDCGWYKLMHAAEAWGEKLLHEQESDVKKAREAIADIGSAVLVEHYFVDFDSNRASVQALA